MKVEKMQTFRSIEWLDDGLVRMLDQRRLPLETVYNEYRTAVAVAEAIQTMVIRGAPAIGAAAAYGLALTAVHTGALDPEKLHAELADSAAILRQSRPTAVNLFGAIDRVMSRVQDQMMGTVAALQTAVLAEARAIAAEDVQTNRQIGLNALPLIPETATIIHHCNTGSLATVDYGTALGIIRTAHEHGKKVHVLADETRPRLQGSRLTAWELLQQGIPFQIIADGASGHFMRTRRVDLCVVGADRVAANGDTANKIGTYNLAVVARENDIPFYVAAPLTTIDFAMTNGDEIEIEERPSREITHVHDCQITPNGVPAANPAFDVTPAGYITGIITEKGVAYPPFTHSLARLQTTP